MKSEITFKDGQGPAEQLQRLRGVRINEAPRETRVHIMPHGFDMPPGGVGEPGVPPFAPALMQRDLRGDRQAHPHAADRPAIAEG